MLVGATVNFDRALKRYLPRAWFRLNFLKYKYGGRGEAELHLVRHLVEPNSTAVDVGASIGLYAAEMARYAGKVLAFEANPQVAALARRVLPPNVEVVNVALSATAGRATLRMPLNRKGEPVSELGTIREHSPRFGPISSVDIEMRRLDDYGIANCSFIKMDVEGHEEAVLDGASELIATQQPVLMVELDEGLNSGTVKRVAARLVAKHYRGFFLSRTKLFPIGTFEPAAHQDQALLAYSRKTLPADREYINNFLFVPEEKCAHVLARIASSARAEDSRRAICRNRAAPSIQTCVPTSSRQRSA